jgi:hypothetical protein
MSRIRRFAFTVFLPSVAGDPSSSLLTGSSPFQAIMDCDEESTVQGQADPPFEVLASPFLPRAERQSRFNHRRGADFCLCLVPEHEGLYLAASHSSEQQPMPSPERFGGCGENKTWQHDGVVAMWERRLQNSSYRAAPCKLTEAPANHRVEMDGD